MAKRPQLPLLRPAERPQRSFEPLDAVVIIMIAICALGAVR